MKYFKEELFDYDYKDEKARHEADIKFREACDAYSKYFDTIKDRLSKTFLSLYYKNDGFHDSLITNINIESIQKSRCCIKMILEINRKLYSLNYKNVSAYNLCVPQGIDWFSGTMCWLYGEFELQKDGQLNHKILCNHSELEITCKKIFIKKI